MVSGGNESFNLSDRSKLFAGSETDINLAEISGKPNAIKALAKKRGITEQEVRRMIEQKLEKNKQNKQLRKFTRLYTREQLGEDPATMDEK